MYTILQTGSFVLQILASIVTIVSTLAVFHKRKNASDVISLQETTSPLGHKEMFRPLKWIMIVSFLVYIVATCIYLYMTEVPDIALMSTIITFFVMVLSFVYISRVGRQSLKTRRILAPKKLWQMLSNEIPSYLEECDGPFRIRIVKIGMFDERFKNDEDEDGSGRRINDLVTDIIGKMKLGKEGQTFRSKETPLYDIIEDSDPYYQRSDYGKIHGIVVFIGNRLSEDKVCSKLEDLANKFPNTPIGYRSFGTYPSGEQIPPFINLKWLRIEDYVDHLVFRYYARSQAWKGLADSYHKAFLNLTWILLVLMLAIPTGLITRNKRIEYSRIVLSETTGHDKIKDYRTLLVNYLLVSPKPLDVKLWKTEVITNKTFVDSTIICNYYRFSENGECSGNITETTLIGQVMQAGVFLLYDASRSVPYVVWSSDGERCEGCYDKHENAFITVINGKTHTFKWIPGKNGRITYDDRRIRLMYSNDGNNAVEVIYGHGDSRIIRKAAKHSDTFLFDIQRFLVAASCYERDVCTIEVNKMNQDSVVERIER